MNQDKDWRLRLSVLPFLNDAELEELTHKARPSAQARALVAVGIPFRRRPDGTLLVVRSDIGGVAEAQPAANGLDWGRVA